MGEHAEWSKYSNFEVAIKVPLLIFCPSEFKSVVINNTVELVDLFPTISELAGLPIDKCRKHEVDETCSEGTSLVDLMKTRAKKEVIALF